MAVELMNTHHKQEFKQFIITRPINRQAYTRAITESKVVATSEDVFSLQQQLTGMASPEIVESMVDTSHRTGGPVDITDERVCVFSLPHTTFDRGNRSCVGKKRGHSSP